VGEDLRADPELLGLYSEIEKPLIEVLANLELTGIRVDVPRLQRLSDEIGRQIDALLQEIFQLAGGEFLPASTQQLAEVLYKRLNLPVLKRGKTGPSTDQEVLEELAQQHPLPAKVLEHRQLTKLKSTYLDALPAALGKDGRLHTTFDQAVAATGRLASINPNLQNIPIRTALGARIREAFIPRTGWKLLSADYSQIELRVLAHVSGDPVLRAMLRVDRALTARALEAKMLLQVHDELVLEAPPSELDSVGPLLVEEMKGAADLAVPLEVELGQGDTWASAH